MEQRGAAGPVEQSVDARRAPRREVDRSRWLGHRYRQRELSILLPSLFIRLCLFSSLTVGQRRHERCRDRRRIRREQGQSCRIPLWQWDPPILTPPFFLPFFRAPGGVVNLVATLGNNMYAGAPARSIFPTKHPSRRASILTRHDVRSNQGYLPLTRAWAPEGQTESVRHSKRCYIFCLCERTATGENITGGVQFYKKRKGRKSRNKNVIINHIYDALREPTCERMNDR